MYIPPQEEVDAIIQLRESFGPDVPLRFDPNGVWTVETAIKYGKQMEDILEYLEDPTRGQEGMAKVRTGPESAACNQYVHHIL